MTQPSFMPPLPKRLLSVLATAVTAVLVASTAVQPAVASDADPGPNQAEKACAPAGAAPQVRFGEPKTATTYEVSDSIGIRVRANDPDKGRASGAGIAGVRLRVRNTDTGRIVLDRVDRKAPYDFAVNLPVGRYRVGAIARSKCRAGATRGRSAVVVRVRPNLSTAESISLKALNDQRARAGLSRLIVDQEMTTFARSWSKTMASSGFRHSGGPYAENIAWIGSGSLTPRQAAEKFHSMWMNSTGHRNNMLNGAYRRVGVGFHRTSSGWWATHVFYWD